MLGGVFLVSPPSLLARFAALQVFDSVAPWDQRSSGGLGLDIYAFVYYLLLSLILSKITLAERAWAKQLPRSFPYWVLGSSCPTPAPLTPTLFLFFFLFY